MTREQLDEMWDKLYPALQAAETSLQLGDMLDQLIVAVWEYQDAHNPPKCGEFEQVLAAAAHCSQQYAFGPMRAVRKEYHLRGLDQVRYYQLQVEEAHRRQQERQKAAEPKPKRKKPKAKAPKAKLAKAA